MKLLRLTVRADHKHVRDRILERWQGLVSTYAHTGAHLHPMHARNTAKAEYFKEVAVFLPEEMFDKERLYLKSGHGSYIELQHAPRQMSVYRLFCHDRLSSREVHGFISYIATMRPEEIYLGPYENRRSIDFLVHRDMVARLKAALGVLFQNQIEAIWELDR